MDLTSILSEYPNACRPTGADSLGCAGGFSGAAFWRLHTPRGPLCLRRWPKLQPTIEQLAFIHAVLRHAADRGFALVPVPLKTRHHASYVRWQEHLWEITPWMPGQADFRQHPSAARLQTALAVLAHFHRSVEGFPRPECGTAVSPSIRTRLEQLDRWFHGDLDRVQQSIRPDVWPELDERARRICALVPRVSPWLARTLHEAFQSTALQPCIGDIWHDHVLFQGERVAGLVDFGSVRVDSVALDVARLLGSMALDDAELWGAGLDAYQAVRTLSKTERILVNAFDRSTTTLAGLNWIKWIYQDRRTFEAREVILSRLDGLIDRLEHLRGQVSDVTWDK